VPYQHWWANAQAARWDTGWVTLAAIILLAAGVALLLLQLAPRQRPEVALKDRRPGVHAVLRRRSLEQSLRGAVLDLDGVGRSRVRVRGQTTAVSVHADQLREPGLDRRVRDAVQQRLDRLELAQAPRLRVRVAPKEGRS
jgi:hypothetical protein